MEKIYRLEFNEKQQKFHHDNYTHEENTNGWFTILESATNIECMFFEAYVNSFEKKKFTKEFLLKCAKEVKAIFNKLIEFEIIIDYSYNLKEKP